MSLPAGFPWYSSMYLAAFAAIWLLARRRGLSVSSGCRLRPRDLDAIIVWAMVGAVAGGRLGYALLYEPGYYLLHPVELPQLWRGGMSFHGGLAGVVLSVRLSAGSDAFWPVLDRLAPWVPLGLLLGRLGNFMTGELWGRPSNLPWAMVFEDGGPAARHPSQLYEAFLEGPILFLCLHLYARRAPASGKVSALLGMSYSAVRIIAEFFREPDPIWGYLAWNWLTWGQVLSFILLCVSWAVFVRRGRDREPIVRSPL